jgi:DNA-binding MarR family transcriptional regulator
MSTRLTKRGVPMVESVSLRLALAAGDLRDALAAHVAEALAAKGYAGTTAAVLQFLSVLECGINFGSDIARNLDVSRQMVAKTVRSLCDAGYLEQAAGPGRQKQILFTEHGEHMMSDARRILADFDEQILKTVDAQSLQRAIEDLESIRALLPDK